MAGQTFFRLKNFFISFALLTMIINAKSMLFWAEGSEENTELEYVDYNDYLDFKEWSVLSDSGWPGNSSGYIESITERGEGIQCKYELKAAKLWPWPEISFYVDFLTPQDFSKYSAAEITIQSDDCQEIYFYFLTIDKNLGYDKESFQRLQLRKDYRDIYLPFTQFKIAPDWSVRNPGFNQDIEWDQVKAFGLHKKGRDGESGALNVQQLKFLPNIPQGSPPYDIEKDRSAPIKHFSAVVEYGRKDKTDAQVKIYSPSAFHPARILPPNLYGANWGVWLTLPKEDKVAPLGLKVIRAGGPFVDRSNWRTSTYTFPGQAQAIKMGSLDEFIQYCQRIGAEPLVQVNALGFAPDQSGKFVQCSGPEDAADLVRYLNKEKNYGVKFFEIGNEPFIWHKVHFDVRTDPCSAEEYFKTFKDIAYAMKKAQNEIDPTSSIKVFAPGISTSYLNWETLSSETDGRHAVEYFLQECRDFESNREMNPEGFRILDVLSFHLFPSFKEDTGSDFEQDSGKILESTKVWWGQDYVNNFDGSLPKGAVARVIPKFRKWIEDNYPQTELALTEFAMEAESMVPYPAILKVLYMADLYGILAKYGVDYALQFSLNSSDQHIALLDDTDNACALYYPLALFANNFKNVSLDTSNSDPDALSVYASVSGKDIVVMAINKTGSSIFSTIDLIDDETPSPKSFSYAFPALSVTCIKFSPISPKIECWEYGAEQINNGLFSGNSDL